VKANFARISDDLLRNMWRRSPVAATALGIHDFDGELDDLTAEGQAAQHRERQADLARLEELDPDDLSRDEQIDRTLLINDLATTLRLEEELRLVERAPQMGPELAIWGSFLLVVREFASLAERLESIVRRTRLVPEMMAVATTRLKDTGAIPPVWVEIAREIVEGGLQFWREALPAVASKAPALEADLQTAANAAAEAFEQYHQFLTEDLQPHAAGDFAIGEDLFNFCLNRALLLPYTAAELHDIGTELIATTQEELAAKAEEIAPGKPWPEIVDELKRDHPAAHELLATYEREMARARDFCREHELVSFPPGEQLDIVETPPFERATIPYAAYMPPAPFEKEQKGFFWVTPVSADQPPDRQEQRLRGHCLWGLPITALHEAYPGHHLQLCHSNRVDSKVRRQLTTTVFAEGWALYCEEMMYHAGFYDDPRTRLFQLKDVLWRACRVVIDVGLHCRGMTFDEAVDLLVNVAHLERRNAISEVRRYTGSPTQPLSYTVGKREILRLRADYERIKGADFDLRQFHDELLSFGTIPIQLVREQMLGPEA